LLYSAVTISISPSPISK